MQNTSTLREPPDRVAANICRGVGRLLETMGLVYLTEVPLISGRRVDVMALADTGAFTVVEIKSSVNDFRSDQKWPEYLAFCDQFYFAVSPDFPRDILPDTTGLIVADRYGGEILRPAETAKLNGSRRKSLTLRFARAAAGRHARLADGLSDRDPAG